MALVLLPVSSNAAATAEVMEPRGFQSPAPCSAERAADILDRIGGDYLTTQVFLDFGRLFRPGRATPGPLYRILLVDLERHTRFLAASLAQIEDAFAASGGVGPLFVLTADGGLLIHAMTRLGVATLCRAARLGSRSRPVRLA